MLLLMLTFCINNKFVIIKKKKIVINGKKKPNNGPTKEGNVEVLINFVGSSESRGKYFEYILGVCTILLV